MVGSSGAAFVRLDSVVASALTRPSLMNAKTVDAGVNKIHDVLPAARIQNAGHFYSRHLLEKFGREMRATTEAGCTIKQLIRFLFGQCNELLHVVDTKG